MPDSTRLGARTIRIAMASVLLVLGVAALALNLPASHASGPFGGQPVPTLFPDAPLAMVDTLVAPAQARARRDIGRYVRSHPARDDAAFSAFALGAVGPPPAAAQATELRQLHRLAAARTPTGIIAANWLEVHAKKDVWKLYVKQYGQQVPKLQAARAKAAFKASYKLANALTASGKVRFARPSPYITDPTLHALNQQRFAKKFSYPSKHSVIAFAVVPLLTRLEPHRASEYRWMADEVSYSRTYAGGHYPSDIAAGAYLGTLISEYERLVPPPTG